jgi:hypothetical protein
MCFVSRASSLLPATIRGGRSTPCARARRLPPFGQLACFSAFFGQIVVVALALNDFTLFKSRADASSACGALAGNDRVLQGVHTLFEILPAGQWGSGDKRYSKLVFIGRNLDQAFLQRGLSACCA